VPHTTHTTRSSQSSKEEEEELMFGKLESWKVERIGMNLERNYAHVYNISMHISIFSIFKIEMPVFYKSVTTNWSSDPSESEAAAVYGKRTEVVIKNGKGYKINAQLNKRGKTQKQVKKPLSNKEIASIVKGQFIPGFWENCKNGTCSTRRLRNHK
jgi:hypothetical protein